MKEKLGMSRRAIERELGISRKKIDKLLDEYKAVQKRQHQLSTLIGDVANAPPQENIDVTGIDSQNEPENDRERDAEIYRRDTAGESKASLARDFGVDRNTIDAVQAKYKF